MSIQQRAHIAIVEAMQVFAAHTDHGFSETIGGATTVVTALPHYVFNFVVVTGDPNEDDMRLAAVAAAESGYPWCVMLRREEDAAHLDWVHRLGLAREDESAPLMAATELRPTPWPAELALVSGSWTLPMHRALLSDAFDLDTSLIDPLTTESLVAAPGVTTVVGVLEGLPVTTAMGIHVGDAVGVFSVGTTRDMRGRGYGSAIIWAATQPAIESGADLAVLQTSPMGHGVYEGLGYEVVAIHDRWTTPSRL